eukprot:COSAG04_NODE_255_length_18797_cov_46.325968_17_plen_455_part_00
MLVVTTGVYFTAGCGGHPSCGANGHCVGLASAACACEGNFIGQFCQAECGCSAHGSQTAIEDARQADSCSAGSCACEGNFIGEFCEYDQRPINNLSTVLAQCAAGMGSHGVVYKGAAYRTLDDAPPEGGRYGAPNDGCQCTDGTSSCPSNYLPLPPGYALAPPDADTIAVIAAHGWSTICPVTAGASWGSANYGRPGDLCGSGNYLTSSDGSHTVMGCSRRVLARCKDCEHGTYDAASSTCACEGNFIGQFCETECPIPDCGAHGTLDVGSIEAAREANSCSALSCTCERGALGDFCETYYPPIDLSTVPPQCRTGMGSHGVVYNGAAYRTLDDAPPEGGRNGPPVYGLSGRGAPNHGCQRTDWIGHGGPNYLPLPPGYALAPPDADTIAVIATHGWSTYCAVAADGTAWGSANYGSSKGDRCRSNGGSDNHLATSGGSHTVTSCRKRVLARCP